MLEALAALGAGEYEFAAELAVRSGVGRMARHAEPARYRAEIEAVAAGSQPTE